MIRRPLALVTLAVLVLAGCGTSSKAPSASGTTAPAEDRARRDEVDCAAGDASSFAVEPPPAADGGPITVTDGRGEEIALDGPAERIVTIEWSYTEHLLAVGVQPVGMADIEGYQTYVTEEPGVAADVTDIGSRQEPSIEQIRLLQPDLILTDVERSAANLDELETIAPVMAFPTYVEGADQLDSMVEAFLAVAQAVDRGEEAVAVLDDLDAAIATGRETLADADLETRDVVLSQGEGTVEAPMFRLFTDSSMAVQIVAELCLTNPIDDDSGDGLGTDYGYISVSLEGLTRVGDAWFLPIAPDAAVAEFEERFGDSPTFTSLAFVEAGRLRPLGEDTWLFGGPISGALLVERVVEALTG